jgi:hypothetical protein
MLCFNIIIVSFQGDLYLDMLSLSYMASIASIQLWIQLFLYLRAFSKTSLFVELGLYTLYDLRYYLLIYLLVLSGIGISIAILDQY